MSPHRLAWTFFALACIFSSAWPEDAQRLSKEDLLQFIPGSKMRVTLPSGGVQRWTNEPAGSFFAAWDAEPGQKHYGGNSPGTWRISDDGKYCVHIVWYRGTEDWCAWVEKLSDGKFSLVFDGNARGSSQMEISK